MRALILVELRKLVASRSGRLLIALPIAAPAVVVIAATTAPDEPTIDRIHVLAALSSVLPALWLLIGALGVTTEFRHGSIVGTLILIPDRARILRAKVAAVALAAAIATCGTVAVALVAAEVARNAPETAALRTLSSTSMMLGTSAVVCAMLGTAVGIVVRDPTAAAVGVLSWLLVAEPAAGVAGIGDWLPGHLARSLVDDNRTPAGVALAGLAVIVGLGTALAASTFARRDVSGS